MRTFGRTAVEFIALTTAPHYSCLLPLPFPPVALIPCEFCGLPRLTLHHQNELDPTLTTDPNEWRTSTPDQQIYMLLSCKCGYLIKFDQPVEFWNRRQQFVVTKNMIIFSAVCVKLKRTAIYVTTSFYAKSFQSGNGT